MASSTSLTSRGVVGSGRRLANRKQYDRDVAGLTRGHLLPRTCCQRHAGGSGLHGLYSASIRMRGSVTVSPVPPVVEPSESAEPVGPTEHADPADPAGPVALSRLAAGPVAAVPAGPPARLPAPSRRHRDPPRPADFPAARPAWLVLCGLTARLLRTGDGRWYLPIGAVAGLAVLNKYLVVLLLAVLAGSLLLAGPRRLPAGRWLGAGILLALALAAPNLWWQARHGWPQFSVASGIERGQGGSNRATFIPFQFVYLAPPLAPFWIAGWLRLWRDPALRPLRLFAIAYPLAVAVVLAAGGKS